MASRILGWVAAFRRLDLLFSFGPDSGRWWSLALDACVSYYLILRAAG